MGKRHTNHWKYKNLILVFLSIVLAVVLYRFEAFHSLLLHLGGFGYIGAFIAGVLFVWTFTAATSALILLILAETLSPIEIGLIAGLGAVIGDMLIFRLVKDGLANEIEDIYNHMDHKKHLKKLFHSKYFNWMLPVFGAVIIASPLPDEVGVSLMGISKMGTVKFAVLSYVLNSIRIFLIILASVFIKP
jgi:hypothetical protein